LSESDSGTSHKTEEAPDKEDIFSDKGCFVAQRELFSFRNIPRLPYASVANEETRHATVGVSKTLFANKSLLLVAVVRELTPETVKVHYFGWGPRWDTEIPRRKGTNAKLGPPAPLWSRTA